MPQRKYGVLMLAIEDDFCTQQTIEELLKQGADKVFIFVPTHYWNGKPRKAGAFEELEGIAKSTGSVIASIQSNNPTHEVTLTFEAGIRNNALHMVRQAGYAHVLIADSDELWLPESLDLVDKLLNTLAAGGRVDFPMIPVAGLPGYPIEGATDGAMVYLPPTARFNQIRTSYIGGIRAAMPRIIHFSCVRRTREAIIDKCRQSGHYREGGYDFEGWIANTLPNIKPGMTDAHMYHIGNNIWPRVRDWTEDEWNFIPSALKPFLGGPSSKLPG